MLTDTIIEDARWEALGFAALAEQAAQKVLAHLTLPAEQFEIAVLACDDSRITQLNGGFRDKLTPTNVLSWPSEERTAAQDGGRPMPPEPGFESMAEELGDIAIAFDTCVREASEADKSIADHVTHLMVHGVLHLLGYDHVRDKDATLMEALETEILGKMGVSDPYED